MTSASRLNYQPNLCLPQVVNSAAVHLTTSLPQLSCEVCDMLQALRDSKLPELSSIEHSKLATYNKFAQVKRKTVHL